LGLLMNGRPQMRGGNGTHADLAVIAKPMPPKDNASTAASLRPRKRMDPAMKAGLRATAWSVLIVTLTYMAMHMFPVSIG
jgi:hypothetical protein